MCVIYVCKNCTVSNKYCPTTDCTVQLPVVLSNYLLNCPTTSSTGQLRTTIELRILNLSLGKPRLAKHETLRGPQTTSVSLETATMTGCTFCARGEPSLSFHPVSHHKGVMAGGGGVSLVVFFHTGEEEMRGPLKVQQKLQGFTTSAEASSRPFVNQWGDVQKTEHVKSTSTSPTPSHLSSAVA